MDYSKQVVDTEVLDELVALVGAVSSSDLWARAQSAGQTLAEMPFLIRHPGRTWTRDQLL